MDFSTHAALRDLITHRRIGLVTDIDGTISPLAPTPDAAQVTPTSRDLLRRLAGQLALVAAITGRGADDAQSRVGLPELVYVGNHGLERWHDGEIAVLPEARGFRPALEQVIAAVKPHFRPGVILQDKRITVSIHYRAAADPAAARAELAPVLGQAVRDTGLRLFEGKMVFEVRPDLDVDKGTAFESLIRDYALDAAVYLGDDVTDADALRRARGLRRAGLCWAVGIGVESDDTPAAIQESADVLVSGVPGVESFLGWLSNALSASSI